MRFWLFLVLFLSISCSSFEKGAGENTSDNVIRNQDLITTSHPANKEAAKSEFAERKSTESPMARPIDVSDMTAEIEKAKKEFERNPNDKDARERLAKAYFERAFALTEAAQYRAALGDFRKGLKLKPDDKEAKAMHDRILNIFASLRREPPKEGEEPDPMPFNSNKK